MLNKRFQLVTSKQVVAPVHCVAVVETITDHRGRADIQFVPGVLVVGREVDRGSQRRHAAGEWGPRLPSSYGCCTTTAADELRDQLPLDLKTALQPVAAVPCDGIQRAVSRRRPAPPALAEIPVLDALCRARGLLTIRTDGPSRSGW
jgi:hypothetical protein